MTRIPPHRYPLGVGLAAALVAPSGCVEVEPEPIVPTDALVATIELDVLGAEETQVTVTLQEEGKKGFYAIHGTDELLVIADGLQTSLVSSRLDDEPIYSATHYTDTPNVDFIVGFHRDLAESAQSSKVQLSERLFPVWPDVEEYSRAGDPLEITWDPSESLEEMFLTAEGSCIVPWEVPIEDVGLRRIDPGTLTGTGDCAVTFSIIRQRVGEVDEAYAGGTMVSHRPVTWTVPSKP